MHHDETMSPEFDAYASSYMDLLHDPVRDCFAGDGSFFHRRKWEVIRDCLTRRHIDPAQLSWLDIGCGQSQLLEIAGRHFRCAVGCDPSRNMLKGCTAIVYEQPSPVDLPFENESFDLITAVCVFHHVHGRHRMLLSESIYRVLKPGGLLCVIEHNPWNPVTRRIVRKCPLDSSAELLTAHRTRRMMQSVGLKVLETAYFLYCPASLFPAFGGIEALLRRWPIGGQYAVFGRKA